MSCATGRAIHVRKRTIFVRELTDRLNEFDVMTQIGDASTTSCGWRGNTFVLLVAVTLLYIVSARLGLAFSVVGNTVTLVWPPSGIALVALLLFGYRLAPGIFLGAWIANVSTGLPIEQSALIALGNVGEALAGTFLLTRFTGFRTDLSRRRDIFSLFFLAACVATSVAATVGAFALVWGRVVDFSGYFTVWIKWWLGDMMGILVIAPFLLVCMEHPWRFPRSGQVLEGALLLLSVIVVSYNVFGIPELAGHGYYPAALAVFPFLIWGALRFDHWGAVTVTLVVSAIAIWGTSNGTGPFAVESTVDSLVGWCAFANIVAVTGLLLAALRAEQRRDQAALRIAHEQLEQRVASRTGELLSAYSRLARAMTERCRLEADLIRVSETQQKLIGQELHDGLGQHLTSLSFFAATLSESLGRQGLKEASQAERIHQMLNEAIATTRGIAHGLYPVAMESRGFIAAMKQLLERTQSAAGIDCSFQRDIDEPNFNSLVTINLYRFAQEAIANVVKHSGARRLSITLAQADKDFVLSICDDGVGIDTATQGKGVGIQSLRQRANLLGGQFDIRPGKQGGTVVSIRYPIEGNVLP